ncbi:MAG: cytochrome c biogenesis protein CcsA [Armatimonadota bacterium]|nr:cytochrome c biogenesis protein CcsA [Armatimonadota bacterium]MCX7778257.1 cytochrome c biogenesis protein CcsA [Armatimonadota bacterium]MDW8025495.1 cytochrome c biogenesis protein CcsA [Armatimonadota bacterium]
MHASIAIPVLGEALIWVSAVSLSIAVAASMLQHLKAANARRLAHLSIAFAFFCVTLSSAILVFLLCARRYDVAYVAAHTSNELPLWYRISAFWAGQEGSMLLWAWFGLLIGIALARTTNSLGNGALSVISLFAFAQLFALVALACKSPFEVLPHKPDDGHGLNPLLRNFWMVVHPPLMLCGYALTSAPYALSPMLLREPNNERVIKIVRQWVLLAWLVLGAGIIIGAYWSYEVLGWGGYWGWDPVENASLVPWLLLTALLHTLAIQRRSGTVCRTCSLLCMFAYVSVIYATFITRSGILREVSVHVFGEAHGSVNITLLASLIAYSVVGIAVSARYWHNLKAQPAWTSVHSVNFASWCATVLLILMACIIELGTSLPLFTAPFGVSMSASPSFYNRALAPFALALLIALSLGIQTRYGVRLIMASFLIGCIAAGTAFLFGMRNPYHIAATLLSVAALLINFNLLRNAISRSQHRLGSCIAHIGVAALMLGISLSASFERSQTLRLAIGQSKTALGYKVACKIEPKSPRMVQKDAHITLVIEGDGTKRSMQMRVYDSPYGVVRQPSIKMLLLSDIYASPIELLSESERITLVLRKGEEKRAFDMNIRFIKFEVGEHVFGRTDEFIARAILEVHQMTTGVRHLVSPGLTASGEGVDESLPDESATFSILAMNADEGLIRLSVERPKTSAKSLHAIVELSIKPFMNLLRFGSVLILIGGLMALVFSKRYASRSDSNAF